MLLHGSLQTLCLEALAVALQHPAVAAGQRSICTLLQISKAWRAAVQCSAASLTDISFRRYSNDSISQLRAATGLARWLTKHPGLIGTLDVCVSRDDFDPENTAVMMDAVEQLLELSLQAASSASTAADCHPLLRLRSYTSSLPASAELLAALPAATLTCLRLSIVDSSSSSWCAALTQLTSLQQLNFNLGRICAEQQATNSCIRAIGTLKQLTHLDLIHVIDTADMHLLPTQLRELSVTYSGPVPTAAIPSAGALADLQHLTQLQHLNMTAIKLADASSLPSSLQSLQLSARWPAEGIEGLTNSPHLTSIVLSSKDISSRHLKLLQQLPRLRQFKLGFSLYNGRVDRLLDVAGAWRNLPLCALEIRCYGGGWLITRAEVEQLMQHVVAATKLSKLDIDMPEVGLSEPHTRTIAICEQLKALKHLKMLNVSLGSVDDFVGGDARHLSALITLRDLQIGSQMSGPYVDAETLCVLARNLTNLKLLDINKDVETTHQHSDGVELAIAAIAKLTGLELLWLETLSEIDARWGLQLLTGLSRLTQLQGFKKAGKEALEAYWTCINAQKPEKEEAVGIGAT